MKECPLCMFENEDDAITCINCGIKLAKPIKTKVTLNNLINGDTISFSKEGIIGREGNISSEVLKSDLTVSRFHLNVTHTDYWQIEHIGKNKPYLNGIQLDYGIATIIRTNDILGLGNQLYKIHIDEIKISYVIKCPVCGKNYNVDSPKARINLCIACDDADKFQIANIKAEEIIKNVD